MKLVLFLLASIAYLAVSGCATTDPDRESDLPWNMPQSWEGSPAIPGMGM